MPRKKFEQVGGFREELLAGEDIDLWLRATYGGVSAHIRAPLFYNVPTPGSLTGTLKDRVFTSNLLVIDAFCEQHPEFLRMERASVRRARAKVYELWGSQALFDGRRALAQSMLTRSVREWANLGAIYLLLKAMTGWR
jgi:hypothetical protein